MNPIHYSESGQILFAFIIVSLIATLFLAWILHVTWNFKRLLSVLADGLDSPLGIVLTCMVAACALCLFLFV